MLCAIFGRVYRKIIWKRSKNGRSNTACRGEVQNCISQDIGQIEWTSLYMYTLSSNKSLDFSLYGLGLITSKGSGCAVAAGDRQRELSTTATVLTLSATMSIVPRPKTFISLATPLQVLWHWSSCIQSIANCSIFEPEAAVYFLSLSFCYIKSISCDGCTHSPTPRRPVLHRAWVRSKPIQSQVLKLFGSEWPPGPRVVPKLLEIPALLEAARVHYALDFPSMFGVSGSTYWESRLS